MKKEPKISAPPYPVRFEGTTYLKIKEISSREARSMNKQIELAVKQMIAVYERTHGEIVVDLDDLDA